MALGVGTGHGRCKWRSLLALLRHLKCSRPLPSSLRKSYALRGRDQGVGRLARLCWLFYGTTVAFVTAPICRFPDTCEIGNCLRSLSSLFTE
jgi:hypothetical protein